MSTRYTWGLTEDWILTTDRPESCDGVPVLVHVGTQQAFGAGDAVEVACWAGELVKSMGDGYDAETMAAVRRFLNPRA